MLLLFLAVVVFFNHLAHETDRQGLRSAMCMEVRKFALYGGQSMESMVTPAYARAMDIVTPDSIALLWIPANGAGHYETANWLSQFNIQSLRWTVRTITPKYPSDKAVLATPCNESKVSIGQDLWLLAKAKANNGEAVIAVNSNSLIYRVADLFAEWIANFYIPFAIMLGLISAWCLAWFAFLPIQYIANAIKKTSNSGVTEPIPVIVSVPEFKELIENYNSMMQALNTSYEQAVRFSADAAHELRTPLTVLKGRIEQALLGASDLAHEQFLIGLQAEVQHLTAITSKLLLLSQADAGHMVLERELIDWTLFINNLLADAGMMVNKGKVKGSVAPFMHVYGDRTLLMRLCLNLMSNAVAYSQSTDSIYVSSSEVDGMTVTRFRNDCAPISALQRQRLFDRFYRVESVRHQGTGGSGLGLSLAREIARAHHGNLFLEQTADDIFEVCLALPSCKN